MSDNEIIIETNEYQTPVTRAFMNGMSTTAQEQFIDFCTNVPYIKWLISPNRPRAKDLQRDDSGKIIVELDKPHILEDMDYFRPAYKCFKENGRYTLLRENSNRNSEYGRWYLEELRRCRDGYVRESDGEWITGYMYWYLNYTQIKLTEQDVTTGVSYQMPGFPKVWDGAYLRFHYMDQARKHHEHCFELAKRGAGKSYSIASIMAHNLLVGENSFAHKQITTVIAAYLSEYLSSKNGTLDKFSNMIDFIAANTSFPRGMYKASPSEMLWQAGRKNKNGNVIGSKNSVMGVSVKDDESKVRGKRGYIFFEEIGSFKNLKEVYNNTRRSVKDGDNTFSLIYGVGTAGDKDSDFVGAKEIMYDPESFDIYPVKNVYDFNGKGTDKFCFFFPAYMSRTGCVDKDGNSDVTKALKNIIIEREKVKDAESRLSVIAQDPITPAEAILKVKSKYFPVTMLNERIRQLDADPHVYDDIYVGELININGEISFKATNDMPIRKWPVDNDTEGALEIFEMPVNGSGGKPMPERYIIGVDPIDNDKAESNSLFSSFVFDLYTDRIVAEYTGRKPFAEDNYEIVYSLCLFYNATCMYEANKKMMYAYFARKNSTWMLADCPEYLVQRGAIKYSLFGSAKKGISINGVALINLYLEQIKSWMLKTFTSDVKDEKGDVHQVQIPNLYAIRSRALLQEAVSYSPDVNTDRISALAQVMLYREQYIIKYGGSPEQLSNDNSPDEDVFFKHDMNRYADKLKRRSNY